MKTILDKEFFSKTSTIIIFATISTFLWGSAFPAVKSGYAILNITTNDTGNTMLFAGYRFFLAGLLTLGSYTILYKKIPIINRKMILPILITGFIQTSLQYIFFYIGVAHTTGIKSSIIAGTSTFFCVIIANFWFPDSKLNLIKSIGIIIGFLGIIANYLSTSFEFNGFCFLGEGLLLFSTLFAAFGTQISRKIVQEYDPLLTSGYQILFGSIFLIIFGIILRGNLSISSYTCSSLFILLYLAFVASVAITLWTILHKYNSSDKIAVFNFLVPIFGSTLSAIFLHEQIFTIQRLVALILICIGIYLVNKPSNF